MVFPILVLNYVTTSVMHVITELISTSVFAHIMVACLYLCIILKLLVMVYLHNR